MSRSNPNSKRGQVRAAWENGGEADAIEVGQRIGIPEKKVLRWCRKFNAAKEPSRSGRPQVMSPYWPDVPGVIEKEGDEVSGVKFRDGMYLLIPNEQIHQVETGE